MDRREFVRLAIVATAALLPAAAAGGADDPILTLRNPSIEGPYSEISFTRGDLESLAWHTIRTGNEFIDGVADFRGPYAHDVISMIGHAGATRVRVIAANDFFTEIEIAELEKYGAILALERDGEQLSLRDHGPIWMMYPIDDYPELQDSLYNSRLVWQLQTIELF